MNIQIPLNKPFLGNEEILCATKSLNSKNLSGDGFYTHKCEKWFEKTCNIARVLLTHSCTGALELSSIILNISQGDEIIMPSFTFVSTANAFALRGAKISFVDIRSDTLNIDEKKIEESITSRTKAIVPVHYAGVSCDMDAILGIAKKHNLYVVEDAAQAVGSTYKGRALGTIGDLGTYSFHDTKIITSGEGGAILVNNPCNSDIAEIIREKGTNRSRFVRGEVDKYTWVSLGSSFLMSEINAAILYAQIDKLSYIIEERMKIWDRYYLLLQDLEKKGSLSLPTVPPDCITNGHIFYVILNKSHDRESIINHMKRNSIIVSSHYVPLHNTVAGKSFGKYVDKLSVTDEYSERILRLPVWVGMTEGEQQSVVNNLKNML